MTPPTPTPYQLMQMHIRALYRHDEGSRLLSINAWHSGPAPRFFLGRTEHGNLWRFRNDLPPKLCDQLNTLCQTEPSTTSDRPQHEAAYLQILSRHAPIERIWRGPAYYFANRLTAAPEPIPITPQNAHLLQGGLQAWLPDVSYQQPLVAIIIAGQAVAICASVRISAVAHEVGVETLPSHRQKGYATAVVSAWAAAVEKIGALPLYSTSLENIASQKVAARLGLSKYGVDFHIT